MSAKELPHHYRVTLRRLIRFAMLGIAAGLIMGLIWTEMRKSVRFADVPAVVEDEGRVKAELPPGFHFEAGVDLKFSHGHIILILGIVPLAFAASIYLVHACGGAEISPGKLRAGFWHYAVGGVGAVGLMFYKGLASFIAIRKGQWDLNTVDAELFGGSRALRGVLYGLSHTLMAVGAFILIYAVFRAAGAIRTEADPPAESTS